MVTFLIGGKNGTPLRQIRWELGRGAFDTGERCLPDHGLNWRKGKRRLSNISVFLMATFITSSTCIVTDTQRLQSAPKYKNPGRIYARPFPIPPNKVYVIKETA